MSLFESGVRPVIDAYLKKKSEEIRDYGQYWSASSAGYCQRKVIFERLGVPKIESEGDARKTRVFEAGHVFHKWYQDITKAAGVSIAQELELQDESLMIRGHIDDLVLISGKLILYDAKTVNSRSFMWAKKNGNAMSHYHKMQLGTYMYMLRKRIGGKPEYLPNNALNQYGLEEARILKIEKDTLMMGEQQLLWDEELSREIVDYWTTLNKYWKDKKLPPCTCADHEGGFLAKQTYNGYFFDGEPCSLKYYAKWKDENAVSLAQ